MKLKCFGDHVKGATVLGSSEKDQTINSKLKVMQTYGVHNKADMKEIKSNGKENSHRRASKIKRRSNAVILKSD